MHEIPEWLHKGVKVQLNPDEVMEEWTLAWIGSIGIVERIDEGSQHPIIVAFEGDLAWHHFRVREVMPAQEKIKAPHRPEYVSIPRTEYEELKEKAWRYEQNSK